MTVTVKTNWHHQANKLAPKQVVRWVVYSVYIFIMTVTMKNKKSIKQMVHHSKTAEPGCQRFRKDILP
jgi:hypothetical protein